MRVGFVPVVQLDVVVAAVGLLLHLEGDEAQLDAVALLGRQQPLALGVTRVVVVPELGVRVEVLLADVRLQTASALCRDEKKRKSQVCERFNSSRKKKKKKNLSPVITASRH